MVVFDEQLWTALKDKAEKEDSKLRPDQQISNEYLSGIKNICLFGIKRSITIRDSFPMYTLHDETHICNVMRLMASLLGNDLEKLSRDETALLVLAACCHDIGMSYSDNEKEELFTDIDRLNQYLDHNHSEYIKAYISGGEKPILTDEMIQKYLRSIHHERIKDLLSNFEWPSVMEGKVECEDLICVCQSHGKDISSLEELEPTSTIDLRFCAILLRLADILDFDTSRSPKAVYEYSNFEKKESIDAIKSKEEWNKHMSSNGFDFEHVINRSYPYLLNYSATSKAMQVEQAINCYLDWVDQELINCSKQIRRFTGKWSTFILPGKIKRNIKTEGYVSGQYRLTLDQDQIIELLVGRDLYSDPSVFVRELIQNSIDAVRTRKQLDKNLPSDWRPQINIRCWMDNEGYHWFRIEDNGIGMTENIIKNYFLKIGCSYYNSDLFKQAKIRCKANEDYMPISRFGIGILSCFMGDKHTNQIELSTKHFNENGHYSPALRLSMHGMNGYYYMASKAKNHLPGPMKGVTPQEKDPYLKQAGTVIAVRTNLYDMGKYRSFKEIVDRFVVYPPVAIHYDGTEGSFDYLTEKEFINDIHQIQPSGDIDKNGLIEFSLTKDQLSEIYSARPEISFKECPKIILKCISLDQYTNSPYLSGALLIAKAVGEHAPIFIRLGDQKVQANVRVRLEENKSTNELYLYVFLNFTPNFYQQMDLIQKKHLELLPKYNNFYNLYDKDDYRSEIIKYFLHKDICRTQWEKSIINRFNISYSILREKINEVSKIFKKINKTDETDIITYLDYRNFKQSWRFPVCKLSKFDWYKKYFVSTRKKSGINSIAAHNGISCGEADSFFETENKNENLGAIILLKDKYRPIMDISRDNIRFLTLETACDIEIIKNCINRQKSRFRFKKDILDLKNNNYSSLPMKEYKKLLDERSDLKNQLIIKTDKGWCTKEILHGMLQKYKKLKFENAPLLSNQPHWSATPNLYDYLCAAHLRENFSLQAAFGKYGHNIYISIKDDSPPENYEDIFPSTFFLTPFEKNCSYLTTRELHSRYSCNINHRLSQFIIKNCEKLNNSMPGIFNEILRVLSEEESGLIKNINEMLFYLRTLPEGLIDIPENIFLTEDDLC